MARSRQKHYGYAEAWWLVQFCDSNKQALAGVEIYAKLPFAFCSMPFFSSADALNTLQVQCLHATFTFDAELKFMEISPPSVIIRKDKIK